MESADGTAFERYEFVHAMYRDVTYRRQSPGHRAMLHLKPDRDWKVGYK